LSQGILWSSVVLEREKNEPKNFNQKTKKNITRYFRVWTFFKETKFNLKWRK
jgi:hypothetical protein